MDNKEIGIGSYRPLKAADHLRFLNVSFQIFTLIELKKRITLKKRKQHTNCVGVMMKYKTNWLGIILISMALLVLGVVFILNLVREEQEFRGLKTLSVFQFDNDGDDVKP